MSRTADIAAHARVDARSAREPLAPLLRADSERDADGWRAFQLRAVPMLEGWTRAHRAIKRRALSHCEDDVRDVVVATLERVRGHLEELRSGLLSAQEEEAEKALRHWLYGALDFAVREHLRSRFGRTSRAWSPQENTQRPSKRDLNTLAPRVSCELPALTLGMTTRLSAREVAAYVVENFSATEAAALQLHLTDCASFAELAERVGLSSSREAELMVRRLKERLRQWFERDV